MKIKIEYLNPLWDIDEAGEDFFSTKEEAERALFDAKKRLQMRIKKTKVQEVTFYLCEKCNQPYTTISACKNHMRACKVQRKEGM